MASSGPPTAAETTASAGETMRRADGARRRLVAILLFCGLFVVYLATATHDPRISIDVVSGTAPAWALAQDGTLDLTEQASWIRDRMEQSNQLVRHGEAAYSGRNPGVIVFGLPAYLLAAAVGERQDMPMWPSALTAAATSAATCVVLLALFRRLTDDRAALLAALLFGLGTGTWTVSADGLWGHGPAQLLLALSVLAVADGRLVRSGFLQGAALTVRPYAGFSAAVTGIHQAWVARSFRPVVPVAAGASVGLLLYLAYTRVLFGVWSVFGGYSTRSYLQRNVVQGQGATNFVSDVFWSLVHPGQGLLPYAPFLLVLLPGAPRAWRAAPGWVRTAFLAGLGLFAAQLYANTWNAGSFFFGYRYPLEFLALSAPFWLTTWDVHVRGNRHREWLFALAATIAIGFQVAGAVLEPYKHGFTLG